MRTPTLRFLTLTTLLFALPCSLFVGCGDDSAAFPDSGTDSGTDALLSDVPLDVAPQADAGPIDSGGDTGIDASIDGGTPARDRLVYVSVGGERKLAVVTLGSDGTLTAREEFDLSLPENSGAMTYARRTKRLYIGVGENVATVSLSDDGAPTLVGITTENTLRPVFLSLGNDESTLITAHYSDRMLKSLDVSGAPPHPEVRSRMTPEQPHAALFDPSGTRIYVPHRSGNVVQWYSLDGDGDFSRDGSIEAEDGAAPRHIAFAPDGGFAYVINELADSVTAYTVADNGDLAPIQTITTLPSSFDGDDNTCADVHVTPDGRFLYGSNRGHDSLAMFSIGGDGMLTSLGQVETEQTPREFDVSPDGRFVIVAGQGNGNLRSYRVEPDGMLTSLDTLSVGGRPAWVIID